MVAEGYCSIKDALRKVLGSLRDIVVSRERQVLGWCEGYCGINVW
jgi:hypothetical protein